MRSASVSGLCYHEIVRKFHEDSMNADVPKKFHAEMEVQSAQEYCLALQKMRQKSGASKLRASGRVLSVCQALAWYVRGVCTGALELERIRGCFMRRSSALCRVVARRCVVRSSAICSSFLLAHLGTPASLGELGQAFLVSGFPLSCVAAGATSPAGALPGVTSETASTSRSGLR